VARGRTTFGKLERDRARQARNRAKLEKMAARAERAGLSESPPETSAADQERIIEALARLHQAYAGGDMTLDDFEARREQLTNSLIV
jgi:hypothetical protein